MRIAIPCILFLAACAAPCAPVPTSDAGIVASDAAGPVWTGSLASSVCQLANDHARALGCAESVACEEIGERSCDPSRVPFCLSALAGAAKCELPPECVGLCDDWAR